MSCRRRGGDEGRRAYRQDVANDGAEQVTQLICVRPRESASSSKGLSNSCFAGGRPRRRFADHLGSSWPARLTLGGQFKDRRPVRVLRLSWAEVLHRGDPGDEEGWEVGETTSGRRTSWVGSRPVQNERS